MLKKIVLAIVSASAAVICLGYGSVACPEDGCNLIWTGKTEFCVGVKCRTVKIYRCGCCSKLWRVYEE